MSRVCVWLALVHFLLAALSVLVGKAEAAAYFVVAMVALLVLASVTQHRGDNRL